MTKTPHELARTLGEFQDACMEALKPYLEHTDGTILLVAMRAQRALLVGLAELQFAVSSVQYNRFLSTRERRLAADRLEKYEDPLKPKPWPDGTDWHKADPLEEIALAVPAEKKPDKKKGKKS